MKLLNCHPQLFGGLRPASRFAKILQKGGEKTKFQSQVSGSQHRFDERPFSGLTLNQAKRDSVFWGRLVKSAVGAHLVAAAFCGACRVFYWREGDNEVDFVIEAENQTIAIEVKNVHPSNKAYAGMAAFAKRFSPSRSLVIGSGGIALETFLSRPVEYYFRR